MPGPRMGIIPIARQVNNSSSNKRIISNNNSNNNNKNIKRTGNSGYNIMKECGNISYIWLNSLFYKVIEHLISFFYGFRCLLHINCIFFHTGENHDNLLQNILAINVLEHNKIQLTDAQNYVKHRCSNST
jgi:hypothetical protein